MKLIIRNLHTLFLLIFVLPTIAFSQNLLNQPESMEWNHFTNQWLVSNHASGEIISVDNLGNHTLFSDTLSSTRGLKVRYNKLYAASNNGLAIFDLASQQIDTIIAVPQALLLNDLDFSNDSTLFVSDYWDNKIFKFSLTDHSYQVYLQFPNFAPNGLIFDALNNRMLACGHNGQTSVIYAFDPDTAFYQLLLYPTIYGLDGFAKDSQGNIYISAWHTDAVYQYSGNLINNNVTIAAQGLNDPADIFIQNDVLAVPNFSQNSVSFISLAPNQIEEPVHPKNFQLSNYPNPFNPQTIIHFSLPEPDKVQLSMYNITGQKIRTLADRFYAAGSHELAWNAQNESRQAMPSGVYFVKFEGSGFQKMIKIHLMK